MSMDYINNIYLTAREKQMFEGPRKGSGWDCKHSYGLKKCTSLAYEKLLNEARTRGGEEECGERRGEC